MHPLGERATTARSTAEELLRFAEARLAELGCIKVNLQIVEANEAAVLFYERHGYETEPRIRMGKRLLSG